VFTEWLNVLTEIEKFHPLMGISLLASAVIYLISVLILREYFDIYFIFSLEFLWRVVVITGSSWAPVHVLKIISDKMSPSDHMKVR
jgi:phospholipid-translocating ATPase